MATNKFKDSSGKEWTIELDAFVFDQVRQATNIDLADLAGTGWQRMDNDADLVHCLAIILNEPFRDFAKTMKGKQLDKARKALEVAAVAFFPQERWLTIQRNLTTLNRFGAIPTEATKLLPAFLALPPEIQMKLIENPNDLNLDELAEAASKSAPGLADTPSPSLNNSPALSG